ncbi:MAG: CHAT domain-containing protein [Acidobacteria bacterium]|nr:CHAT domain-containing protein [Acidobacteriota bacterium]
MPNRFFPKAFVSFFLLLGAALAGFAQDAPRLELNQPVEREIKGGETHAFTVTIGAGQTARIEVEQRGVDVSLAALRPSGERFIETESPSGLQGSDLMLVTAADAGDYRVEISPADPRAAAGRYVVKLAEIRPTVPEDAAINEAAVRITKLANETVPLRQKATRESRRQALEKFREIIALSKIKKDKIWETIGLLSIGLLYEQLGEIQNDLNYYLQGLALAREIGSRQYEGTALNNLAVNYNILGEYETAVFYLNQALNLQRETKNRRGEAINLNNLGMSHLLLKNLPKAQEYFEQSLVLRREVKDQRGEATSLNNLGHVYLEFGDYAKSIDFFQQGLVLRQTNGDRAGEAVSLRNLGRAFWESGDKMKAVDYFTRTNALTAQLGDRRGEADSLYWLALAERENGNLPKAIDNIERGLRIIEQVRGELVSPELRTAYFSTVQEFYELYTELLVARFEKSKLAADAGLAFEISERARSRSLVELLQEARVNVRQGVDEKLVEREADLLDALNAKYRQRTQLLSGKSTPEQISRLTDEITSLTTEFDNLQAKIRLESPRYADLRQTAALSAKDVGNLLGGDTVLLEYKLGTARSFLWLVTKDSTELFVLPPRREIETKAKAFYEAVVRHNSADAAKTGELAKALDAVLLAPVAEKLKNRRAAIVADGILQFIPFAALDAVAGSELVVLPSANVLAEIRRDAAAAKTPEKTLAIFADAVFDANDARVAAVAKNVNPSEKGSEFGRVLRDFDLNGGFPRLLSSRVEARNISAFVPKTEVDLNVDFDASRENVTDRNLGKYRILHFATHGLLDTSRPEFSGLVLSLFDRDGRPRDGFLRLNQIYNLNLNSELVVLSACQTALGKDVRGEGLIGLTRGFLYAGAKRIVSSLWKVDDAATAEFMKIFYRNLLQKKLAPAAALRAAQTEIRQIPRFRAPYFWAGFTIQGEWK